MRDNQTKLVSTSAVRAQPARRAIRVTMFTALLLILIIIPPGPFTGVAMAEEHGAAEELAAGEEPAGEDANESSEQLAREQNPIGIQVTAWWGGALTRSLAIPYPVADVSVVYQFTRYTSAKLGLAVFVPAVLAVEAGARCWLLRSDFTPTLFINGGAGVVFGGGAALFSRTGVGLDWVHDSGFHLGVDGGLGLLAATELGVHPFWMASLKLGARF